MITIRLPPDIERRMDDLVSRAGHTKTFYITLLPDACVVNGTG